MKTRTCKCGCGVSIKNKHPNAKFLNQKHKDSYHNKTNPRGIYAFMNINSPDYNPEWDRHIFDVEGDC